MNFEPRTLNFEPRTGAAGTSKRPVQRSEFKVQTSKFSLLLFLLLASAVSPPTQAAFLEISPAAQVTSAGIFLDDLATSTNLVVPHERLFSAPRFGQTLTLSRQQIITAASRLAASLTNFAGPEQVRVTRRARTLDEEELKILLTAQLQHGLVKDRGGLELRFARPWAAVSVPDEPLSLRVSDLPATGISALFIARVEIIVTNETLGGFQVSLHANLWRDVWTSRTALRRGALLADADLVRERRDVLSIRDALAEFTAPDSSMEAAEHIAPNTPLLARSIKTKPAVRRGQSAEAIVSDGALMISMKVEVLEDGAPGQIVRMRNPQTKRELRGKVQSEQTILISL